LGLALERAEKIQKALAPYCRQIAIAGSIRRLRPNVGDIDLVLEPKPDCRNAIIERTLRTATRDGADGQDYSRFILRDGLQLDLWWVRPPALDFFTNTQSNWGMRLLVATGSRAHNIELAKRAKALGKHFAPYRGIEIDGQYDTVDVGGRATEVYRGGRVGACLSEEQIFAALGVPFVVPQKREVGA